MAADAASLPKVIFHPRPDIVCINERAPDLYHHRNRLKIETLINRLTSGPVFCCGPIGPNSYAGPSVLLQEKIGEQELYGWVKGTPRDDWMMPHPNVVLGARNMENGDHDVFFTPATQLPDQGRPNGIHRAQPSNMDQKVYRTTLQNFFSQGIELYHAPTQAELDQARDAEVRQAAERPTEEKGEEVEQSPQVQLPLLSETEREFIDRLIAIPQASFQGGDGMQVAKALGQEIFDHFFAMHQNPFETFDTIMKICSGVKRSGPEGVKQMEYLRVAWDGIGHGPYRWGT